MGILKTPAGGITVSSDLEKFFKEVGKVSEKELASKRKADDKYIYKWTCVDGQLKTTVSLREPAKILKGVAV